MPRVGAKIEPGRAAPRQSHVVATALPVMIVTADHSRQLRDEGYTVLDGVIPAADVDGLRRECARSLASQIADMNAVGAEVLGLSRKQQRHFLPVRHDGNPVLTGFLFGDLIMDIVVATVGRNAWFFLELFVTKEPRIGGRFGWHQDSGYLPGTPHRRSPFRVKIVPEIPFLNGTKSWVRVTTPPKSWSKTTAARLPVGDDTKCADQKIANPLVSFSH